MANPRMKKSRVKQGNLFGGQEFALQGNGKRRRSALPSSVRT
jgi:hypothetical protein